MKHLDGIRPSRRRARARRLAAAALLAAAPAASSGCRTVEKEAGVFHARATGFNILFFTVPPANFDVAKRLVTEEVGETAEITNVDARGLVPPWWNLLNRILGADVYEISGTY